MTDSSLQTSNLDEPEGRLMWARIRAKFETATDAARRFNWNENTYRSHENGQRGLSKKAAAKYGRAFKVPSGWLLYGEGAMTSPIEPELRNLWDNFTPTQRQRAIRVLKALAEEAA